MSDMEVVNSWKDMSYRRSLNASRRTAVASNPAGTIHVQDSTARFLDTFACTAIISCPCCNNC